MNSKMKGKENEKPEESFFELLKKEVKKKGKRRIYTTLSASEVFQSNLFQKLPLTGSAGPSKASEDVGQRLEAMLKLLRAKSSTTILGEGEVINDNVNLQPNKSAQELMEDASEEQLELECAQGQETQAAPNVEGVTGSLEAMSLLQPIKIEIYNNMDESEEPEVEENVVPVECREENEVVIPKDEMEEEGQAASGGVQMEIEIGPVKLESPTSDGEPHWDEILIIDEELEKAEPDFVRLSNAMIKTYEYHRKPVYDSGNVSVAKLQPFPALKHYAMIKQEYCLIKNDLKKMEQLEERLNKIFIAALEQAKNSASNSPKKEEYQWWTSAIKLWKKKKQGSSDYQKLIGIVAVCIELVGHEGLNLLCKIKNTLLKKEIKLMANPTIFVPEADILKDGVKIWIYADKTKFLGVLNIYEAVLSVYASYYVLNYEYPPALQPLFEYFDMLSGNPQDTYRKTSECVWPPVKIACWGHQFIKQ